MTIDRSVKIEDLKAGDTVQTMITGVVGNFEAEVIRVDRYPVLRVNAPGSQWDGQALLMGDYIVMGRVSEPAESGSL